MNDERPLGLPMMITGALCVVGVVAVLYELLVLLPTLPDEWWLPERPFSVQGNTVALDLRTMFVHLGLVAWLGGWGYLGSFIWLPVATIKIARAARRGIRSGRAELALWLILLVLLVCVSALVHLTPLRYPSYNIPLL